MASKANSFIGIGSGTGVTTGNSGGTSGDAFDTTVISTGCSLVVNTSADLTAAYDRGVIATVDGANEFAVAGWTFTSGSTHYVRFYYRTPAGVPTANTNLMRFMSGATAKYSIRHGSTGNIELQDGATGVVRWTTIDPDVSTIYRIEAKFTATGSEWDLRVAPGETTSYMAISTAAPTTTTVDGVQFGYYSGSTPVAIGVEIAAVAWSDTDWIGPAVVPAATIYNRHLHIG